MKKRWLLPCAALLVISQSIWSSAQNAPSAEQATADANASKRILIRLADKRGNPVQVSKDSLTVQVDQQKIAVEELQPAKDVPLDFLVLMDISGSTRDKISFQKDAARKIFEAFAKRSNRGYLGFFNSRYGINPKPLDSLELDGELRKANPQGGSALSDALATAVKALSSRADNQSRRRVVFLISDGEDNESKTPIESVIRAAQHDGIPIFALALVGEMTAKTSKKRILELAEQTGGKAVILDSPHEFISDLLRPIETQYVVSFKAPASETVVPRKLEVTCSDPSVKVTAPRGF